MLGQYTSVEIDRNRVCYRGRDENGREIRKTLPYRPSLFVPAASGNHTTYNGQKVGRLQFSSIKEARDYVKRYEEVTNHSYYGNTNYQYTFISDNFPGKIKYNPDNILIWKLDIEVASENGFPDPKIASEEITSITVKANKDVICFGCGEFTPKNGEIYIRCYNEIDLIEKFVAYWEAKTPDIITGWNIRFFDIPYIVNRIKRILGDDAAKRLSPWKNIRERDIVMLNKESRVFEILGVSVLDYIDLYRKFAKDGKSRESYKLGYIAQLEIGETKLDGVDETEAFNLYKIDFQKFMEYNVQDVILIEKMDQKLKLIELALTMAYNAKCNIDDVLFQTRMWDCLVFNQFVEDKMVFPQKRRSEKEAFVGAFVKDPQIGWFDNVTSWDLTSLYPHLIMQYNISPEMMVNPVDTDLLRIRGAVTVEKLLAKELDLSILKSHHLCMTPNGMFFKINAGQGFMPKLMERMFHQRDAAKQEMIRWEQELQSCDPKHKSEIESKIASLNNLQLAIKVCLNSAYGSFSNPGFRFYDHRIGLAITSSGQLSILWIQKAINCFLNDAMKNVRENDYIIASDTDSMYLAMNDILKKYCGISENTIENVDNMNKICEKVLKPTIDRIFVELKDYMNAYQQKMVMKREAIAEVGIWTSKKHYILSVWDNEKVRYKEPKLKITGLEAVKASAYPKVARETMKKIFKEMVVSKSETKVQEMIADFRKEFMSMKPQDISFPRGVKNVSEYVGETKSIPIHVKGSLVFNDLIKRKGLTKEIETIKDGAKIKYAYLKLPNPMQSHVIAFQGNPPKELELDKWIDYNIQFEKTFLDPVTNVLDVIGWSNEPRNTLF